MHKDYFNFNKVLKFDQREEKSWLLSSVDNDTYVLLENNTTFIITYYMLPLIGL